MERKRLEEKKNERVIVRAKGHEEAGAYVSVTPLRDRSWRFSMVPSGPVVESPKHSAGAGAIDGSRSRGMTAAREERCRSHSARLITSLVVVAWLSVRASPRLALKRSRQWGCTHIALSRKRDIGSSRVHGVFAWATSRRRSSPQDVIRVAGFARASRERLVTQLQS